MELTETVGLLELVRVLLNLFGLLAASGMLWVELTALFLRRRQRSNRWVRLSLTRRVVFAGACLVLETALGTNAVVALFLRPLRDVAALMWLLYLPASTVLLAYLVYDTWVSGRLTGILSELEERSAQSEVAGEAGAEGTQSAGEGESAPPAAGSTSAGLWIDGGQTVN